MSLVKRIATAFDAKAKPEEQKSPAWVYQPNQTRYLYFSQSMMDTRAQMNEDGITNAKEGKSRLAFAGFIPDGKGGIKKVIFTENSADHKPKLFRPDSILVGSCKDSEIKDIREATPDEITAAGGKIPAVKPRFKWLPGPAGADILTVKPHAKPLPDPASAEILKSVETLLVQSLATSLKQAKNPTHHI